jgi:hypothetical protein
MQAPRWPTRLINWVLVVTMLSGVLPHRPAWAGLAATESVIAPESAREGRAQLRAWLAREDVQTHLRAYGVSAEEAAARVDALTDKEVALVVARLDEIPAGGNPIAALALLFVLVVYGAIYAAAGIALLIGFVVTVAVRAGKRDRGPVSMAPTGPSEPSGPPADLKWPPINSSYVMSVQQSGSYGSESRLRTIQFLGEQPWQGSNAFAFSDGTVITYVDSSRRILARVNAKDGSPIESYAPYFVFADWPLSVGKSWPNRYRYVNNTHGRSFDNVQYDGQVEAYEDVATAAGTFKAFKIVLRGASSDAVVWYSDDLGLVVKTRAERFSNHYLGSGVQETELVTYEFGGADTTPHDPTSGTRP